MKSRNRNRPTLWRRLLSTSLLASLIPALSLVALLLLTAESGEVYRRDVADRISENLEHHTRLNLDTQAQGMARRLNQLGFSVLAVKSLTAEVLSAPEIYCAYAGEEIAALRSESQEEEAANPAEPPTTELELPDQPREDPLFYSVGQDGAYRKPLAVGSAVFYRTRELGRGFSLMELQRLYALAAVDSLLSGPIDFDPLCGQMFVLTHDGLLRTFPYRDVINTWEGTRNLNATPLYAWSADKADQHGLVWTSPYLSSLSGEWVVACLAAAEVGGQVRAVVGCEILINQLPDELLTFSLASGGMCWLQRTNGEVLAAQLGVTERLGIEPIATAALPTDETPAAFIHEQANLYMQDEETISSILKVNGDNLTKDKLLTQLASGDYLLTSRLPDSGWFLCGLMESPALGALDDYQQTLAGGLARRLLISLAVLAIAILLSFGITWYLSRRIVDPLRLMAAQTDAAAKSSNPLVIGPSDEGEIAALGEAIQLLINKNAVAKSNGRATQPDGTAGEDSD